MYTVTKYETSICVPQYLEDFVEVQEFLKSCKSCPNYNKLWSCPPYEFDVLEYWNRFSTLKLLASKIVFNEELLQHTYSQEELEQIYSKVLPIEKQNLSNELFLMESDYSGSVSLSAGSCQLCKECSRPSGTSCCHPDTMRYSLESLGANVGHTIRKLMGINLEWIEEGKLPKHFVLVSGLLIP